MKIDFVERKHATHVRHIATETNSLPSDVCQCNHRQKDLLSASGKQTTDNVRSNDSLTYASKLKCILLMFNCLASRRGSQQRVRCVGICFGQKHRPVCNIGNLHKSSQRVMFHLCGSGKHKVAKVAIGVRMCRCIHSLVLAVRYTTFGRFVKVYSLDTQHKEQRRCQ